jgi:hypothetical protein
MLAQSSKHATLPNMLAQSSKHATLPNMLRPMLPLW